MNNKTVKCITIKLRGDGVYDVYIDKKWVMSKGSLDSVVNEVKNYLSE